MSNLFNRRKIAAKVCCAIYFLLCGCGLFFPLLAQQKVPPANPLEVATQTKVKAVQELLTDDLRLVVRTPYIIAGDLSSEQLAAYYDRLIQPSAAALHRQYFTAKPDAPLVVWLFRDEKSYAQHAERIYGDKNVSIYGYYKPDKRALVMNINTGGGTLVHELTHALAAFDFPGQPDWFNEGLASLYEASSFQGEGDKQRILGLVNWRLNRLQQAIKDKELGTLTELIQNKNFRGEKMGLNYAQARYFCLYLQEIGKLEEFYAHFRQQRLNDATGLISVQEVLGSKVWNTIDADYQRWVMTLKR